MCNGGSMKGLSVESAAKELKSQNFHFNFQ